MNTKINWPTWPKYTLEHELAVVRVIRSNQLFAAQEVLAFEQEFSAYVNSSHAIGVGNATQGLHLALAALGVGTGDEVIVTPYSWISSASCVLMQNAVPIFVDIESDSFGICPEALKRAITPQTKAVILVHMFGLASQVKTIQNICLDAGIALIEDASHSHGAMVGNRHLGTFGDVGVFSLHQRKAISTGDGGILVTDNSMLSDRLRRMRSFGADQLSYNYRMNEFAAALGRVGLRHLDHDNEVRVRNHQILADGIKDINIKVIQPAKDVHAVYYSNLIDIHLPTELQDSLLLKCATLGIPLKRTWQPLHFHPHFVRENMSGNTAPWDSYYEHFVEPRYLDLKNAQIYQTQRLFELDCHPLVTESMVEQAADVISSFRKYEV
jgi:perosamine synthetase